MSANISPLAQTFKISDEFPQGCFISSIDLFLAYKDPLETNSIEVQIVETLNGYPTDNILDNAKSLMGAVDVLSSSTALVPTKFKFPVLIFLKPATEYAVKVISNSLKYKAWTAVIGEPRVDNPSILITQQPALGSMFKSQNNSTWTPEQLQDLTFRLNRAKFNTGVIGKMNLVEAPVSEYQELSPNPFKTTLNQSLVSVLHENHGLAAGMYVVYSGSTDTQFNSQFTVMSVLSSDRYTITKGNTTDVTNHVGGGAVKVEKTVKYDTVRVLGFEEGRDVGIKLTSRMASSALIDAADTDIVPGEYLDMTSNKYVHSSINRTSKLAGANSFTLKTELSSINDAISPVIDLNELTVQLLSNKINNPTPAIVNYLIDGINVVVGSSNVSFATTGVITVPAATDYSMIKMGAWIQISDAGGTNDTKKGYITDINTTANTITLVGDALSAQASRSATLIQYNSFVSEIADHGTAESKTITKPVVLTKECEGFKVVLEANLHTDTEMEMYYRVGLKSQKKLLSETNWTKSLITYKKSVNESEFNEYSYGTARMAKFDQFQFKFVFLSSNTAVTPKIKKLRIIAHA